MEWKWKKPTLISWFTPVRLLLSHFKMPSVKRSIKGRFCEQTCTVVSMFNCKTLSNTHSLVLDYVLHDGHPSIVLLDQPQPVGLAHSSLPVDRRRTRLSWGRHEEEASAELRNNMSLCVFPLCVCVCVCAFPRRGAGGSVRYEIRMQHEEREGLKLN